MLKKMLELLFLMCLTSGLLYGEEVALVTNLTGEATARWLEPAAKDADKQNTEGKKGSQEWKIEIAEMLPDGAEVKTGAKSELTIVHLVNNTEYHLSADSFAKITAEGVEGSACASVPLQLVSTNFQLGDTMKDQVGAVVADRNHQKDEDVSGISQNKGNSSYSVRKGLSENLIEPDKLSSFSSDQAQWKLPDQTKRKIVPQETKFERITTGSDGSEADEFGAEERSAPTTIKTGFVLPFALPFEMISEICTNEAVPSIDDYKVSFSEDHEGWLNIKLDVDTIEQNITLKLLGNKGYRALTLYIEAGVQPSVALAWRLEKSGLLAQAASVWMALEAEGMDAKKVDLHLKRIKGKLLAK
ncbi:MAG: hypothetical protein KKB51_04525 [Candidatus Riflebacteria bacterium]|nr:hypothetical protein [Candidatus Riflebacteria bacterium]